jgi:acyl dehydratase
MVLFPGKAYDEIKVGDSFGSAMTVTETHLVLAAGLFGDFNPLHTNEMHAKPKHRGGIAVLSGVCRNQQDEVVVEADGKILVKSREKD